MKGYIYRLYAGADPAAGWTFNDPIFGRPPTLGACVPNVRRSVDVGDWVFCITGRIEGFQPYVAGGFQIAEKLTALSAYRRFPEYRLSTSDSGQVIGNIIVDSHGGHHPLDDHDGFERRIENYLVGGKNLHVVRDEMIARARAETVPVLSKVFEKQANRSFEIVPRWRRMNEKQVSLLSDWLRSLQ